MEQRSCGICLNKMIFKNEFEMMQNKLYEKHSSNQNYYHLKNVNDILMKKRRNIFIQFRFYEAMDTEQEFLKRIHVLQESRAKLGMLGNYYKYHGDIPRIFIQPIINSYNEFHDVKRRIYYKQITKLLNQEKIGDELFQTDAKQNCPPKVNLKNLYDQVLLNVSLVIKKNEISEIFKRSQNITENSEGILYSLCQVKQYDDTFQYYELDKSYDKLYSFVQYIDKQQIPQLKPARIISPRLYKPLQQQKSIQISNIIAKSNVSNSLQKSSSNEKVATTLNQKVQSRQDLLMLKNTKGNYKIVNKEKNSSKLGQNPNDRIFKQEVQQFGSLRESKNFDKIPIQQDTIRRTLQLNNGNAKFIIEKNSQQPQRSLERIQQTQIKSDQLNQQSNIIKNPINTDVYDQNVEQISQDLIISTKQILQQTNTNSHLKSTNNTSDGSLKQQNAFKIKSDLTRSPEGKKLIQQKSENIIRRSLEKFNNSATSKNSLLSTKRVYQKSYQLNIKGMFQKILDKDLRSTINSFNGHDISGENNDKIQNPEILIKDQKVLQNQDQQMMIIQHQNQNIGTLLRQQGHQKLQPQKMETNLGIKNSLYATKNINQQVKISYSPKKSFELQKQDSNNQKKQLENFKGQIFFENTDKNQLNQSQIQHTQSNLFKKIELTYGTKQPQGLLQNQVNSQYKVQNTSFENSQNQTKAQSTNSTNPQMLTEHSMQKLDDREKGNLYNYKSIDQFGSTAKTPKILIEINSGTNTCRIKDQLLIVKNDVKNDIDIQIGQNKVMENNKASDLNKGQSLLDDSQKLHLMNSQKNTNNKSVIELNLLPKKHEQNIITARKIVKRNNNSTSQNFFNHSLQRNKSDQLVVSSTKKKKGLHVSTKSVNNLYSTILMESQRSQRSINLLQAKEDAITHSKSKSDGLLKKQPPYILRPQDQQHHQKNQQSVDLLKNNEKIINQQNQNLLSQKQSIKQNQNDNKIKVHQLLQKNSLQIQNGSFKFLFGLKH